eukprot:gnl/TRDRNA2_/TRDRNA2_36071_c0_seq1.p1 gnl/TRDRNA2_/TRDRNA2_36071_c0~~gnl/TRDRNA2_/TRDRNA2_36071_c0_seq1.p1  ORF type:complete len:593 (+),score=120.95 gnl/TRDRNA2_/TRDRNA2_36071_c0_seq1:80-1858(+)
MSHILVRVCATVLALLSCILVSEGSTCSTETCARPLQTYDEFSFVETGARFLRYVRDDQDFSAMPEEKARVMTMMKDVVDDDAKITENETSSPQPHIPLEHIIPPLPSGQIAPALQSFYDRVRDQMTKAASNGSSNYTANYTQLMAGWQKERMHIAGNKTDGFVDTPDEYEKVLQTMDTPEEVYHAMKEQENWEMKWWRDAGFPEEFIKSLELERETEAEMAEDFLPPIIEVVEEVVEADKNLHERLTSPVFSKDGTNPEGILELFNSADFDEWCVLTCTIIGLLVFDNLVLKSLPATPKVHTCMLFFWIAMGVLYNVYFFARYGEEDGMDWCSGYFLEWLLSMDNVFVFHLIFNVYKTPHDQMHKALFWGIVGAVVFRMLFFLALGELLHMVKWLRIVFGAFLIYSGIQTCAAAEEEDEDLEGSRAVRVMRACMGSRLKESYDLEGHAFFIWEDGRTRMTMLFFVVLCCELTDVLFAIDSVSAKIGQISNQYTAYSSSIMALFGSRSMFFIMEDLVELFELLKYGFCFILVFIGLELMFAQWVSLDSMTVCVVILSVFFVCIGGSLMNKYLHPKAASKDHKEQVSTLERGG